MAQSSFLDKDSPVDFLYLDKQRVSSLIGQLSDRGMLIGLKSMVAKSQGKEGTAGLTAVAKAEGKISKSFSESSEETYDPFWMHAYTFLQDLEANFAVPLNTARVGDMVKFRGLVQLLDLKILRNLWEPGLRAFVLSQGQTQQPSTQQLPRKKSREQQQQAKISEPIKAGLELLKEVPHLLHMTFLAPDGFRFWAAAQPEYPTISSEHLVMKYGAVLDGLWTVVGVVDGTIGDPPAPLPISPVLDSFITAMTSLREAIGRPKDHWGITPIAIYAPLRGMAEAEAQLETPDPRTQ